MADHPLAVLRRIPPDQVQLQVILGCLLGDGVIVGARGSRRLRVSHRTDRGAYVDWKWARLGALVIDPPRECDGTMSFETIAHPFFDDLVALLGRGPGSRTVLDLLRPLGLAVWMADLKRLDLRIDSFLPAQREGVLASEH